jgi:hypothetical protein
VLIGLTTATTALMAEVSADPMVEKKSLPPPPELAEPDDVVAVEAFDALVEPDPLADLTDVVEDVDVVVVSPSAFAFS